MGSIESRGLKISDKGNIRKTIHDFLKKLLKDGIFDGILIPVMVPAGDSYAWVLVKEPSLLDKASPVPPVMPVQGAKALKSYTRKGKVSLKVAALMRPCEIRASVELTKLNQVHLDNITLISYDCPGALPMADYLENQKKGEKRFDSILNGNDWRNSSTKPVCRICDRFSLIPSCDLHFGIMGNQEKTVFLIPNSKKGRQILKDNNLQASEELSDWRKSVDEHIQKIKKQKKERFAEIKSMAEGFNALQETFANCIGCHNCQSACPICYCRQCYFDSEVSKQASDFVIQKAERRGGISFPLDKIMFHVGRMSHMSLSCVACGLCSDACPVSIPVADVFSYVADHTQKMFEYEAGKYRETALPIKNYRLDEIRGVEELVKNAEGAES
jgi:formate dehydrogenase subunit beta